MFCKKIAARSKCSKELAHNKQATRRLEIDTAIKRERIDQCMANRWSNTLVYLLNVETNVSRRNKCKNFKTVKAVTMRYLQ